MSLCQNHLPVFTLPMTLTTLVILLTNQGRRTRMCGVEGQLQRTKVREEINPCD